MTSDLHMDSSLDSEQRRNLELLLIDDEAMEYDILMQRLELVTEIDVSVRFASTIEEAVELVKVHEFHIVFLDNRLIPNDDFRQTAPLLRKAGYVGPLGIVSSDISGEYFQQFEQYGVDFRIGKDEINYSSLIYLLNEYTENNDPSSSDW